METKICSYTENGSRLQLVRISDPHCSESLIELRFNRRVLRRFTCSQSMLARFIFSLIVQEFVVLRDTSILSKIT